MGFGVIETDGSRATWLAGGVIASHGREMGPRLRELYEGTREALEVYQPDAMVLEEVHAKPQHPRTAILMAHARGVICLAAALTETRLTSYAASAVKRALTGNGNAGKEQVQSAVAALLRMREPVSFHISDALALALCHSFRSDPLLAVRPLAVRPRPTRRRVSAR
jgi:crossover junction endodeoxyribonuclease RuvC